jgi:5-methylcytosine-specific restriction enzyme subunit McrC
MNIPIENIYYMLCYAWDKLEEREIVNVEPTDKENAADFFARILSAGITHLLKKGLDRGYETLKEETGLIRGKIDFATTLKRNFFKQPKVFCEYDEFSYNVLHNRILKSTVLSLMKTEDLNDKNKQNLHTVNRRLNDIEPIELSKRTFGLVQLHSNNYFYDFLMHICEWIYDNLLPSENEGQYKFRDFERDKGMPKLFEEFIRNFYKQELDNAKVESEQIRWKADGNEESMNVLPVMETDTSIQKDGRKIIVDTKYYKQVLCSKRIDSTKKLISWHLYQLFAYLSNEKSGLECDGMLLYPVVDKRHRYDYSIKGHKLMVRTIDLSQNWRKIENDLHELINSQEQEEGR